MNVLLRRIRRDADAMRTAMQLGAVSSAAALLLLGLAPGEASADGVRLRQYDGAGNNPLDLVDVGPSARPALADIDADGDFDLFVGRSSGFVYFENTGTPGLAVFTEVSGAGNPLDGATIISSNASPAFADLDGDGDLDMVSGSQTGNFAWFENVGTAVAPSFVERTGAANPLDGFNVEYLRFVPAIADVDGDGDPDVLAGNFFGEIEYFENVGDASSASFVERTGAQNPFDLAYLITDVAPALADCDADGDLDLVVGNNYIYAYASGGFVYYENVGSATSPSFVERSGADNPIVDQVENDPGTLVAPALADLDADGDPDLLAGNSDGQFVFLSHRNFIPLEGAENPLDGLGVAVDSRPTLVDLDADGDPDLVVGNATPGTLSYFENTGTAVAASFVERTGAANPFDFVSVVGYASPSLGDLDDDGDLDLVVGESSFPVLSLRYFENSGTAASPSFTERTGAANPFDAAVVPELSAPALGDLDGDGDLDLVLGGYPGGFQYFENTGSVTSATFVERSGGANPLDGFSVGDNSTPDLVDLDADGDLDVVSGTLYTYEGSFLYFENVGSAGSPSFVERDGIANPLSGEYVGFESAPTLMDLDGDGDLDLVSGNIDGELQTWRYCPEPGSNGLLLSGGLLLALLGRRRHRA